MASDPERHTYTDWRPAITVGMVVLAILVLVLLVLLIAAANQQQPFLMAVIVVMFGLVALAFAGVVQRLNAAHRADLLEVIKAQAPHARMSAPSQQTIDLLPAPSSKGRTTWAPEMKTAIKEINSATGQVMEIDPELADRFIKCCYPVVSREKWRGDNNDYLPLCQFFSGMKGSPLIAQASGWRWADWVTLDALRSWSLQARGIVTA